MVLEWFFPKNMQRFYCSFFWGTTQTVKISSKNDLLNTVSYIIVFCTKKKFPEIGDLTKEKTWERKI